jgi:transposase InsO family protein
MSDEVPRPKHVKWAHFKLSVVGPLLADPPEEGQLESRVEELAAKTWKHPITGKPFKRHFSTIERWYYLARGADDPIARLARRRRDDRGGSRVLGAALAEAYVKQYREHEDWSVKLHYDNLKERAKKDPSLGDLPSYATVARFVCSRGLQPIPRSTWRNTQGADRAYARVTTREVRSFERSHVLALWHFDFHVSPFSVLLSSGTYVFPELGAIVDDHSRLCCHAQWYVKENTENACHAFAQALMKRGVCRELMTDCGGAMNAGELTEACRTLGILHQPTLPYSPYQNGKMEVLWARLNRRLMAMLNRTKGLTLAELNLATQAWIEQEYNRTIHTETGQMPLERFLRGPQAGRSCPDLQELRIAFTRRIRRRQRKSDGTVSLKGTRFEVPGRYRHLSQVLLAYADWDLSFVLLLDPDTHKMMARLYPLDRRANADGRRRRVAEGTAESRTANPSTQKATERFPPLLARLMEQYQADGLPAAYLPKDELLDSSQDPERSAP